MESNKLVLFANLDNLFIHSKRLLPDLSPDTEVEIAEEDELGIKSFMTTETRNLLIKLCENPKFEFIPVTSRPLEEYRRIDLGIKPKYAVVGNGSNILIDGEPDEEYANYVKKSMNYMNLIDIQNFLCDSMESVGSLAKILDNTYLRFKIYDPELFDMECVQILGMFPNQFTIDRVKKTGFITPIHFSKQIAVKWIINKIEPTKTIGAGTSVLDVPMLTLIDRVYIPSDAEVIRDGIVMNCRKLDAGTHASYHLLKIANTFLAADFQ